MTDSVGHDDDTPPGVSRDVGAAKREARNRAAAARGSLARESRDKASADASLHLLALTELSALRVVLAYFALPAEIDPLPTVSAFREAEVAVAYPRIASPGVLEVHLVDDERDLVPGSFGLWQPREDATPVALTDIDAVILPGLAFDAHGNRLGYGGGYYDRLLPRLRPDCLRIGLAFDQQLVPELPAEDHDATVDVVVTQTRVIRPSSASSG